MPPASRPAAEGPTGLIEKAANPSFLVPRRPDKPVFVYKLVAQGTVEERMLELQQRKKALAAGIYEAGGNAAAALDAADIERLFEPLG